MSHVAQSFRRVASTFKSAPKALLFSGALVATIASASVALPASAQASTGLQYHQGYSVQNGWYCFGWTDGAYRCTSHWVRARDGRIISRNTSWVPNYNKFVTPPSAPIGVQPAVSGSRNGSHGSGSTASHPSYSGGAYNPGKAAIIAEIQAVFGPYANQALNIAACESGFDPNAHNPTPVGGAHAAGVFQILDTSTWYTTSYRSQSPYNASANIHAAYEIFHRDGNSWREWACRP